MLMRCFPSQVIPTDEPGNATAIATTSTTHSNDPSKAKKGKLAAKSTGLQYQFQIMESIGKSCLLSIAN